MITISNDDAAFFDWLDAHERDGYFLNTRPRGEFMLHVTRCPHVDRLPSWRWTKNPKHCSTSAEELERWVLGNGGTLVKCNECFR